MPAATITFTVAEADVARVEKALCNFAQLEINGTNAKQAVINWVNSVLEQEERRNATFTKPTIT